MIHKNRSKLEVSMLVLSKIEDLFLNLFANAISFFAGVFLPKLWNSLTKARRFRALNKFWGNIDRSALLVTCVHLSTVSDGEESTPRYLGFGDATAMKQITEILANRQYLGASVTIREYYEGKLLKEDKNNNLICVGGGIANEVTTEMLYSIGVPRHFFDKDEDYPANENKTVRNHDDTWSVRPHVQNGRVIEDVGIIVKSQHPFYKDKVVIIFAGAYSYGTLAAAKFATEETLLRQCENILDADRFEIIIKAKPDGYNISQISVEWAGKF